MRAIELAMGGVPGNESGFPGSYGVCEPDNELGGVRAPYGGCTPGDGNMGLKPGRGER